LTREEELCLARRLEKARSRFRRAALLNWLTIDRVVDTFEKVQAGQLAVDPTIDVVTSLGLSKDRILARMPHHLRTLRHLSAASAADFRVLNRTKTSSSARRGLRRGLWRRLRKAVRLVEELSPRTELIERWTKDVKHRADVLTDLERRSNACG